MADSDGKLVANNYHHPDHTVGPDTQFLSPEDCEKALLKEGPARTLEALVWIGGCHWSSPAPPASRGALEDAETARQVAEARKHLGVRRALRQLVQYPHPWIKKAAREALRVIGESPDPS